MIDRKKYPVLADMVAPAGRPALDLASYESALRWAEYLAADSRQAMKEGTLPSFPTEVDPVLVRLYVEQYRRAIATNVVELYRKIGLNSWKEFNPKAAGLFWSFKKECAQVCGYSGDKSKPCAKEFLLTGHVNPIYIDWEEGFKAFLDYGEEQWECTLKPGVPLLIVKVNQKPVKPIKALSG